MPSSHIVSFSTSDVQMMKVGGGIYGPFATVFHLASIGTEIHQCQTSKSRNWPQAFIKITELAPPIH